MALVADTAYQASITFVDNDANKSTMRFLIPASLTNVEASALVASVAGAAVDLSNAAIESYRLSFGSTDNELDPSTISEASDVEGKLVFVFKAANGQISKTEVPSPKGELVIAGTQFADPANADVAAFITLMTSGNVGAANGPVTNTGADLTQVMTPIKKIHRGSSKG